MDSVSGEHTIAIHDFNGAARESESTVYVFDRDEYGRIALMESCEKYINPDWAIGCEI